jgi:RND superfamily putative drug exporter
MLAHLAHLTVRHRWAVVVAWLALTLVGAVSAGKLTHRWYQGASVPGGPAYETGQRARAALGVGARAPVVVVFHTTGDATRSAAIERAMRRAAATVPGSRSSSFFSTGSAAYVSRDRHTAFEEIYPPGSDSYDKASGAERIRATAARGLPAAVSVNVTGSVPLEEASKHGAAASSASVLAEGLVGGLGALLILLLVFGTLPAVLMPLAVAVAAILNTFTLVWALTYVTRVSIIVEFLIVLVGLGVAIDYALLMIMRFREELRDGRDVEPALAATMTHAGRSVILSGSTVAIGLLAMAALPVPLVRSMAVGGVLIPLVSVLAATTLLPALLAILGTRIDSVRLLPRRLTPRRRRPEDALWGRWARLVLRRPLPIAALGLALVAALASAGTLLNANEAQLRTFPGTGTAIAGRQMLADAHISPGVMRPLDVLVQGGGAAQVAARLRTVPGVEAATALPGWQRGSSSLVEAFPSIDGAAPGIQGIVDRVDERLRGTDGRLTGVAAIDRDLSHALMGSFPAVFAIVVLLTLILLARAFRSIVLAVKAVILNMLSLGAALGVVVLVFQQGHGSGLWGIDATQSVTPWIPLMIFAFLFGLTMDYEVFMLTRMREAYDETGSTDRAIELGLARTGKLVTSGALILAFAFLVLSTSPGYEVKPLAIGIAAGIVLDATVIRALLVPAMMRLLGDANWWMPGWAHTLLRIPAASAGPRQTLVDELEVELPGATTVR